MSKHKSKSPKRETVALEALRQGMALIRKGHQVYGLHADGSKELLSSSRQRQQLWADALAALKSRKSHNGVKNTTVDKTTTKADVRALKIYSDGGSRGNPGPSASGYVILTADESHILEKGGEYLGITTNNQAEYQAVKLALEAAVKFDPNQIEFCMDSLLVANQLNGVFKVKNKALWPVHQAIKELAQQFDQVAFRHVYREHNQLADEQVNKILDETADLQNA